ncbi:MAG TPA: hypothetical protein VNW25_00025 [Candidatus Sulfotelmatobacter sp.]|nr:hypothetical protein [Candidatus Sulfotelmatobacter sp.]
MPIAEGIDQSKGVTHTPCGADLGGFSGDICPNCKKAVTKENTMETGK